MLEVRVGEDRYDFADDAVVTIGRSETSAIPVLDHRVSRHHLEARCEHGYWRLVDLDSANGTYVAGRPIREIDVRRTLDLCLADPDDGIVVTLTPLGANETVRVAPSAGSAPPLRIGRALDNDLVLDDTRSSRYHAELVPQGERAELRDRASANGTRVNGRRIDREVVEPGDLVEIGDTTMRVVPGPHRLVLEVVARGATLLGPDGARPDDDGPGAAPDVAPSGDDTPKVTVREREVIALVAGGASDKQIAAALFISINSVRSHLDRIQQKTGRRKRADLTRLAYELGVAPRGTTPEPG